MKSGKLTDKSTPHWAGRENNCNLIRLGLAILVLLSHSPELVDGDRSREPLTQMFGSLSFGELAVYCFFLLSGFLIVQSWERHPDIVAFARNRALRIYPGFVVACIASALIFAPLGTRSVNEALQYFIDFNLSDFILGMVFLRIPDVPMTFQGTYHNIVNGPVLTIAYEMRCYFLVALLGLMGLSRKVWVWLAVAVIVLFTLLVPGVSEAVRLQKFYVGIGQLSTLFPWLACFASGACFYLYRERIRFDARFAVVVFGVFAISMLNESIALVGLMTFGAYALFSFAFSQNEIVARYRKFPDISYGMYLYGWPVQKVLLWYLPHLSPWTLFPLSVIGAGICGLLSWTYIEKPYLQLKARRADFSARDYEANSTTAPLGLLIQKASASVDQ